MIVEAALIASLTLSSPMVPDFQFNNTSNHSLNFNRPLVRLINKESYTSHLSSSTEFIFDNSHGSLSNKHNIEEKDLVLPRQIKSKFDANFEVVRIKRKKINLIFD